MEMENLTITLPCDDVLGSVDDLIAGFAGFESAMYNKKCSVLRKILNIIEFIN